MVRVCPIFHLGFLKVFFFVFFGWFNLAVGIVRCILFVLKFLFSVVVHHFPFNYACTCCIFSPFDLPLKGHIITLPTSKCDFAPFLTHPIYSCFEGQFEHYDGIAACIGWRVELERLRMTLAISTGYIFGRPSQPDHHVSFPAAHSTDWLPLDISQQTPFLYSLLPLALRPPLPPPPRIFSIIRNLEAISKLARFRHGKQRHLCSLLHTADPNKLKPSDLLTHAIIITFSLILHSPQNNWYPSPAC